MKSSIVVAAMLLLVLLSSTTEAQLPNTLSYQGILTDSSGNPKPNGTYAFTFRLYDVEVGGAPVWNEVKGLEVKSGLFSAILGNQASFDGLVNFSKPYWLGIQVQSDPELSPRIPLSSVAYSFQSLKSDSATHALYADSSIYAKSAPIANGTIVRSLNQLHDNIVLVGAGGATVTSTADSIVVTASGGSGTGIQGIQNTNNTLDIADPNGPTATINLKLPFVASASTSAPVLEIVNLSSGVAVHGFGVEGDGILGNSTNSVKSGVKGENFSGGNGVTGTTAGPSAAGVYGNNEANGMGVFGISTSGDGIIGKSAGTAKSGIWGDNTGGGYGVAGSTGGASTAGVWGSNSANGIGVKGTSTNGDAVYGMSLNGYNGVYGESQRANGTGVHGKAVGGTAAWGMFGESTTGIGVRGIATDGSGIYGVSVGSGYAVQGSMTGTGRAGLFEVSNASNNLSGLFAKHNGTGNCFASVHSGTGRAGYFEINNVSSNATALYVTTNGSGLAADFNGEVAVNVLQIKGGSDMAEPFETVSPESVEPGSVMVLDPSNTEKIIISSSPYDKKVVGVVSGAGGVKAGLTLRQENTMDGNVLVAIAGRVYCKAEALTAPIEPGDLLTTSTLSGYAMKAVDPSRSYGTIIGKAMSKLDKDTGLVLILVNLQ